MTHHRRGLRRNSYRLLGLSAVVLGGLLPTPAFSAPDTCPNAAVRAQQEAAGFPVLPDCRAYEMVNPNTDDQGEANRVPGISDDGNIAAYQSVIPDNKAIGGAIASISVARRTTSGWQSTPADPFSVAPPAAHTGTTLPLAFSTDFSRLVLDTSLPLAAGDINDVNDTYRVDVGTGASTLISFGTGTVKAFGASRDLRRVAFLYNGPSAGPGVYVTDGVTRQLVSVFPDGTPALPVDSPNIAGSAYQRGPGIDVLRGGSSWVERGGSRGVSDDGLRVFFNTAYNGRGGKLYVRDFTGAQPRTVAVSPVQRTGAMPGSVAIAQFIAASQDGATVYFSSSEQLTDDATPGGGIYRFDLASGLVTQVTPDAGPGSFVVTAAIASDDLSHIYFTSTSAFGGLAQAGDANAYVWSAADGVRFIGKVESPVASTDNNFERFERVTPDGRYALIVSAASLGGAANAGRLAVYRYDDATGKVDCVSCRPDGTASEGASDINGQSFGFPAGPVTHNRALTLDGRVVFTSTDRLTPDDQTSATDVYLWDKGEVSLLTAGRGDAGSYVGDISDDGNNIFIYSRSALIGSDRDADEYDVYDVRVDGGFLEAPPAPDPCRGDDCQGTPSVVPGASAPASAQVSGDGNVPPAVVTKRLNLARLSAVQRSTLARTGKVSVSVRVSGGGTLTVRGRGRIASVTKTLGSVKQAVLKTSATTVKVTFGLSAAARRELTKRHQLSVRLEARLSGLSRAATTTINLTAKKGR